MAATDAWRISSGTDCVGAAHVVGLGDADDGRGARDGQAHGNDTGTERGPRTWPPFHSTVAPSRSRKLGDARQPLLDGDLQLHAGQVRAEAAVDADAEREVPVALAVDARPRRDPRTSRVAVAGREGQQHPLAGRDGARRRPRPPRRPSRAIVTGRVGPQELLDGGRDELGLVDQPLPVGRGGWRGATGSTPIELHVVSMPATRSRRQVPRMCFSVSGAPSMLAPRAGR